MAAKLIIAAGAALLLAMAGVKAQESPADPEPKTQIAESASPAVPASDASAEDEETYYYTLGEDGRPSFTQVLRWEADPYALEYGVTIRDASTGDGVIDERTAKNDYEFHLNPGEYEYKIVTYNLLGKAEAETDWTDLTIIKAEMPKLESSSPATLYMDSLDGRVTLSGDKLLPDAVISLAPQTAQDGKTSFEGKVLQQKSESEIVVIFPDRAYEPGEYSITIKNPGGLSAVLENALKIRYQRPVDILVSAGYSPFISLTDKWVTTSWTHSFNPVGLNGQLELFFVKQHWGFVGVELGAQWRRMTGGEEKATLTSDYLLAGANVLYKYRFARRLHGLARLGGGISWSKHSFDYEGFDGPVAYSRDPYAQAGLALQGFLPSKLYGEIGADYSWLFLLGHTAAGITPKISVGYQLF
jgi:hypothetical protein